MKEGWEYVSHLLCCLSDTETIHPLLEMLGFVPSAATTGSSFFNLSYIDYQALEVASGISTPTGSDLDDPVVNDWLFYIGSHQVCPTR